MAQPACPAGRLRRCTVVPNVSAQSPRQPHCEFLFIITMLLSLIAFVHIILFLIGLSVRNKRLDSFRTRFPVLWPVYRKPTEYCDTLYKAGRSTQYTSGRYNGIKQTLVAKEIRNGQSVDRPTMEHAGSQAKNVSYFTHTVDPVEDIKSVTGAVAMRVMGGAKSL